MITEDAIELAFSLLVFDTDYLLCGLGMVSTGEELPCLMDAVGMVAHGPNMWDFFVKVGALRLEAIHSAFVQLGGVTGRPLGDARIFLRRNLVRARAACRQTGLVNDPAHIVALALLSRQ